MSKGIIKANITTDVHFKIKFDKPLPDDFPELIENNLYLDEIEPYSCEYDDESSVDVWVNAYGLVYFNYSYSPAVLTLKNGDPGYPEEYDEEFNSLDWGYCILCKEDFDDDMKDELINAVKDIISKEGLNIELKDIEYISSEEREKEYITDMYDGYDDYDRDY